MQVRPPGDESGAVDGFELVELRPVDDAGDHFTGVDRDLQVGRHDPDEVLLRIQRWRGHRGGCPFLLAVVEAGHHAPTDTDRVVFVLGKVIGEPGLFGVHACTTERFVVALLPGRCLDQRRPTQEHLGPVPDHDHVVAHARDVGPTGGGVAEHQGDRGDPGGRQAGQVAEGTPARDEDLLLAGQVGAAGLHQADQRHPVLFGDLGGSVRLLQGPGVGRPTTHGGVVGHDDAFHAADHTDAAHHTGPDGEVTAPGGQCGQFQKRTALVQEQFDAFACQEFASGAVALDVLVTSPGHGLGVFGVDLLEPFEHDLAGVGVLRRGGVKT